jgi:hypothetical protein
MIQIIPTPGVDAHIGRNIRRDVTLREMLRIPRVPREDATGLKPVLPPPADRILMTDLERANAELRGALILAGKRIVKLNFGRREDPVLQILRRVLRESRQVAKGTSTSKRRPRAEKMTLS